MIYRRTDVFQNTSEKKVFEKARTQQLINILFSNDKLIGSSADDDKMFLESRALSI